jgi:hypothetical protein
MKLYTQTAEYVEVFTDNGLVKANIYLIGNKQVCDINGITYKVGTIK